MAHEVETMAWTGEVPWHGLGFKVAGNLTPAEMQAAAKLDWTVSKQPLVLANNTAIKVPNRFALVRDSDNQVLSVVGSSYKPVQNAVAVEFFAKFVKAGKVTMETMGSLHHGRYVWALAKIKKDFKVGKGDQVDGYILLCSPFLHGMAMIIQTTGIRVVCWNTLNFALGRNLKGHDEAFRMPHMLEFDETMMEKAAQAVGLATKQMELYEGGAKRLASKRVKPEQVELYFNEVLQFDPKEAVKLKDGSIREPKMLLRFRDAIMHAPGQNLATAEGTWWGAFNAVTATVDHVAGRVRDTALASAWVGYTADMKRRAFDLALIRAK